MAIGAQLRARVEAWIADDPDLADRAELTALLDRASRDDGIPPQAAEDAVDSAGDASAAVSQLEDRFAGRLTFGTAGLRGQVGAGPNRMNRAVVRAATSAVAGWLRDSGPGPDTGTGAPAVVIGCDARHRSDELADEAARVLAAAGVDVHLLPRPCPTPLVAFAVRHLSAQAGIMVTASHNPRTDNGYKLYLSDGAQVIPPVDAEIEGRIAALGPLRDIATAPLDSPRITRHGDDVEESYLSAITGPARQDSRGGPDGGEHGDGRRARRDPASGLRVVYTPMHGVAGRLLLRAVERAGFPEPHVVAAQARPDPDFPTAAFPNPEEPAALALALADAEALDADLVLANDPDGDRLAVAVPEPGPGPYPGGRWRILTGDQVGALLGAYLLAQPDAASGGRPLVATTIVSATLLSAIAATAGALYRETLTGFKWIARAADDQPGAAFAFGYEEAIGYAVGATVRDKDGIGAAVAFLRLATDATSRGQSVADRYDDLERAHGVHLTSQLSLPIPGTGEVMRRLRAAPPVSLAGQRVEAITDYLTGGTGLPPSDVLSFRAGRDRVVIRPSGTEPKIKAYFEIVEPVPPDVPGEPVPPVAPVPPGEPGAPGEPGEPGAPGGLGGPGALETARLTAAGRLRPLRAAVSELLTELT